MCGANATHIKTKRMTKYSVARLTKNLINMEEMVLAVKAKIQKHELKSDVLIVPRYYDIVTNTHISNSLITTKLCEKRKETCPGRRNGLYTNSCSGHVAIEQSEEC